jgi:protein-disulfide isomerase
MRRITLIPVLLCLLAPAWAADKAQPPGITREQADAILNELRQIRQLLEKQARPAPAPVPGTRPAEGEIPAKLKIGSADWLGKPDAPITMVEYTDYQCSFCQRFHLVTFPEIRKRYIDTGKVRFLSLDFPLDFHSNAFRAAEAGRCAGDQNQFWKMRDLLVADPSRLSENDLFVRAESLGLKMEPFRACLSSGKHREAIQKEMAEAAALSVSGTPSFIIGRSTPEGVDGTLVVGAQPMAVFEAKLKELGAN